MNVCQQLTIAESSEQLQRSYSVVQKLQIDQLSFQNAISYVFLKRYKCSFSNFLDLIIFEKSLTKVQKDKLWNQISDRAGLTNSLAYRYYEQTWSKMFLSDFPCEVRIDAYRIIKQYLIQNYFNAICSHKTLLTQAVKVAVQNLSLTDAAFYGNHYHSFYIQMMRFAQSTLNSLLTKQPRQKLETQFLNEGDLEKIVNADPTKQLIAQVEPDATRENSSEEVHFVVFRDSSGNYQSDTQNTRSNSFDDVSF